MIDLERLEDEINEELPHSTLSHSAIQIIAHAITRLSWRDAESMGKAIQDKQKDGISTTEAIQVWAEEWESFE
jgi:hypothetical protein